MPDLPRILAVDTSGRHGSIALALGPTVLSSRDLPATSRHAIELVPAIQALVTEQGWPQNSLDHLYLSLGPGSFTGLRIALAFARAYAQAAAARIVGIPSLDIIAQNAPRDCTLVIPLLDAKRGQIFAARYERQADASLTQSLPAALVDPAQFLQLAIARAEELLATHSAITIGLLGEGLDYHRPALLSQLLPSNVHVRELDKSLWPGRATTLHHLGYAASLQNRFTNPATLLPLYIRLPEAEEVYRKKHNLPLNTP